MNTGKSFLQEEVPLTTASDNTEVGTAGDTTGNLGQTLEKEPWEKPPPPVENRTWLSDSEKPSRHVQLVV